MEAEEVRRCIDSIRRAGRKPDAALIGTRLNVPAARVRELLKSDPALNEYLLDVRADIRDERNNRVAEQQAAALESGAYVPYKEPQNLGRKVNPVDIAKNPRYWPKD